MFRHAVATATAVAAVACLLAGFVFAQQLSSALAVRFEEKTLPPEPTTTVLPASELMPLSPIAELDLPDEVSGDPLLTLAVESLHEAADTREHTGAGLTVVVDVMDDGPDSQPDQDTTRAEWFTASLDGTTLTVEGPRRGVAQGLFRLADAASGGGDWADVADGTTRSPTLAHRFVDTGAVGIEPDVAAYLVQDDYAHTSGALENVVLDTEPWIDPEGLERMARDWREFVDHVVAYGYNGVYVAGFLEYVSFDTVGDGFEVYPADHPERHRQAAMREQVGQLWRYADDMGLDVVFKTDMLALSGPLEDYLERELGGIDANDPRLWEVYRAGLEEFFTAFPWADGLMIRIGEAGAIYNPQFWDYYSALAVTDPQGVQTMLRTAADVAAEHDATVYFRTWSVGVGEAGDMHTNPQTYERVLGGLDLLLLLRPGADGWALWAALGGALLLRTVLLTGAMSFTGPGGYWFRFWTDDVARTGYVTVATAALLWVFVVVVLVLRSVYGVSWLGAIGLVLAGIGVPLLALGTLTGGLGLERALTAINDQMAVLPLGLSRILGIVTHLGIPPALPSWLLMVGAGLTVLGVLGCLPDTLRKRPAGRA